MTLDRHSHRTCTFKTYFIINFSWSRRSRNVAMNVDPDRHRSDYSDEKKLASSGIELEYIRSQVLCLWICPFDFI